MFQIYDNYNFKCTETVDKDCKNTDLQKRNPENTIYPKYVSKHTCVIMQYEDYSTKKHLVIESIKEGGACCWQRHQTRGVHYPAINSLYPCDPLRHISVKGNGRYVVYLWIPSHFVVNSPRSSKHQTSKIIGRCAQE